MRAAGATERGTLPAGLEGLRRIKKAAQLISAERLLPSTDTSPEAAPEGAERASPDQCITAARESQAPPGKKATSGEVKAAELSRNCDSSAPDGLALTAGENGLRGGGRNPG